MLDGIEFVLHLCGVSFSDENNFVLVVLAIQRVAEIQQHLLPFLVLLLVFQSDDQVENGLGLAPDADFALPVGRRKFPKRLECLVRDGSVDDNSALLLAHRGSLVLAAHKKTRKRKNNKRKLEFQQTAQF